MTETRPPNAGLTWSGRWHYLRGGREGWALCGASPYTIGEEPRHLKQQIAEGKEFPVCKKCTKIQESA